MKLGNPALRAPSMARLCTPMRVRHCCFTPSMCTCRMCLVHIEGVKQPLPSCTTPALPGMVVTTNSDELFHIRRTNLEMLLSDHNAYCQPPCQIDCPTHIDIPGYLELIAKGSMKDA